MNLIESIRRGESKTLELKSRLPQHEQIAKTAVAFANTSGGLPNTLTADALLEGRSEIRNRAIARVFKELGYIEQRGSGIQRIKSACLAQGLAEPRIREKGDFVDVEFYRPAAEKAVNTEGESSAMPTDDRRITGGYRRMRLPIKSSSS